MARAYWPGEEAVGKRFKTGGPASPRPWLTVVGVVGDIRQMGLDAPAKPEMYLPYPQTDYFQWFAPGYLAVRTSVEPQSLVASIRREGYAGGATHPGSQRHTNG